jgi:ankyrin repeat protein
MPLMRWNHFSAILKICVGVCSHRLNLILCLSTLIAQFGITPLMLAAERDHPRIVKLLLDKGADLDIVDMVQA